MSERKQARSIHPYLGRSFNECSKHVKGRVVIYSPLLDCPLPYKKAQDGESPIQTPHWDTLRPCGFISPIEKVSVVKNPEDPVFNQWLHMLIAYISTVPYMHTI